jgi:hydrogenase large subunit
MYRGYEMILIGRHPEDALATTARLCGICSTSHVVTATHALENAWNITPPAQAVRLRNLFLAAESLMSDARQGALFFGLIPATNRNRSRIGRGLPGARAGCSGSRS